MDAIRYEYFVRNAFEVERSCDPAKFAEARVFNQRNLEKIKATVVYCMIIYSNRMYEESKENATNSEIYIDRIMNADNCNVIAQLICEYSNQYGQYLRN